ncbi:unnamed protein product [Rangifer tarandus platyrhynchus]|uniref:Uncharacterized protein n=1 Tax=Rangifer tarandus platyrhynchus TaxID=3082113 RepID=A0AC59YX65_RANTA
MPSPPPLSRLFLIRHPSTDGRAASRGRLSGCIGSRSPPAGPRGSRGAWAAFLRGPRQAGAVSQGSGRPLRGPGGVRGRPRGSPVPRGPDGWGIRRRAAAAWSPKPTVHSSINCGAQTGLWLLYVLPKEATKEQVSNGGLGQHATIPSKLPPAPHKAPLPLHRLQDQAWPSARCGGHTRARAQTPSKFNLTLSRAAL